MSVNYILNNALTNSIIGFFITLLVRYV